MKFDEHYFKSLNYTHYLERRDRYLKVALELHELFDKLRLIGKESAILDYGCAVGFLMEGFHELGYKNVFGYDISEWAVKEAKKKGLNILDKLEERSFDIAICLDVLEHMTDSEIRWAFCLFQSQIMVVRIPCTIDGKRFVLDTSNRDHTHIKPRTKAGWTKLLIGMGYTTILPLNMLTIYDTPGVMCALCLKSGNHFL